MMFQSPPTMEGDLTLITVILLMIAATIWWTIIHTKKDKN